MTLFIVSSARDTVGLTTSAPDIDVAFYIAMTAATTRTEIIKGWLDDNSEKKRKFEIAWYYL